jgi:predicted dehydrogenase
LLRRDRPQFEVYDVTVMSVNETPQRVGLLGCGRIASAIHLRVLTGMRGVAVTALAEPNLSARQAAARLVPEAACFSDFAELLTTAELDAVVITLPSALHAVAARAAFQRGLHVYLEKPLASSVAEGREVLAAWRRAGTVGMIGYNYRFLPAYQRARALIQSDHIGPVVALRSVFSVSHLALPEWKQRRETGGGALLDLISHHLDLAVWLIGKPPCSVACDLLSRHSDDDVALVQLEFPGGISAQLFAAFAGPERHRFDILGERGTLGVDVYGSELVDVRPASLDGVRLRHLLGAARALTSPTYWVQKITRSSWQGSYRHALSGFIHAVRVGAVPQPDLTDGFGSLVWLDAASESARDNRRVSVGTA